MFHFSADSNPYGGDDLKNEEVQTSKDDDMDFLTAPVEYQSDYDENIIKERK